MAAKPTKFPENEYLYPPVGESSRLLVGCRREDYSASRLAHAVEDCNAHVLNLNITSGSDIRRRTDTPDYADPKFPVIVDMRVSHRSADSIARSLERYGFTVLDTDASESSDNDVLRERLDHLWRYLNV